MLITAAFRIGVIAPFAEVFMILFILHLLLFTPRLHQHRDWLYLRGSRGLLLVLFYTLFAKQTNNIGRVTLDKKFSPKFYITDAISLGCSGCAIFNMLVHVDRKIRLCL